MFSHPPHTGLFARLILLMGPKWLQWFWASYINNNIQAEGGNQPCLMSHFKTEETFPGSSEDFSHLMVSQPRLNQ